MKLIGNELISATIMSFLITFLVLLNTPSEVYKREDFKKTPVILGLKTFILSFATTFAIFYFISDPVSVDIYKNIITKEPDF